MNENFLKAKKKSYTNFILLTCILCIGIILLLAGVLVLTLAKIMGLAIPLIIIGIACALAGMYGAPAAKLNYRTYIKYEKFLQMVNEEGILDSDVLMERLNMSEDAYIKMIDYCNKKGLLEKTPTEVKKEEVVIEEKIICSQCGKEIFYTGNEKFCPFCGAIIKKEEIMHL